MEQDYILQRVRRSRRGGPTYATPRDINILRYLWKWKVASTASIHEAVNRNESPYSTYKVLEKLFARGFVASNPNWQHRFHVWSLTEKGFNSIKTSLGGLKEDGFSSENHEHDRLVQAFHLGEWSKHQVPCVMLFSEQELRRIEMGLYPHWVPRIQEHRPDGYTRIQGPEKASVIAYEVELSSKGTQRYESTLRIYQGYRQIERVFWLVSSPSVKDEILNAKSCIRDTSLNFHVFVDQYEYEKNGWDAAVTNERSQKLFTMRENLRQLCGDTYKETMAIPQGRAGVNEHLNPLKVIGKTRR